MKIRSLALGAALAGSALAIGAGNYVVKADRLPSFILTPVDQLPPEIPQQGYEGKVCVADTNPCTTANALAVIAGRNQIQVKLSDISPITQQAVIDAEDHTFWENNGFSLRGAGRAATENVKAKEIVQGGSTLSNQLVQIIFPKATQEQLEHEDALSNFAVKSTRQKIGEWVGGLPLAGKLYKNENVFRGAQEYRNIRLALKLNQAYSKEQILEKYLNTVYFGRGAYGIEAAARAYFGKSAKDLNIQESAELAGAIRSPDSADINGQDPRDPQLQQEYIQLQLNSLRVIDAMYAAKHLTLEQANLIKSTRMPSPIPFNAMPQIDMTNAATIGAQHAVHMAIAQASGLLNLPLSELAKDYVLRVTLNTTHQAAMNNAMHNEPHIQGNELEAAGVALRKDGGITALVGSKDYNLQQNNFAIGVEKADGERTGRDSGSGNKGYAWATALALGWTPGQMIDVPASIIVPKANAGADWLVDSGQGCNHFGRPLPCKMTLEEALAASSNIVTAQIVRDFGITKIVENMRGLGVRVKDPFYPALIIGSGELTPLDEATGYNSLILNHGSSVANFILQSITHGDIPVYNHSAPEAKRVFEESVAIATINALNAVITNPGGTAYNALPLLAGPKSVAGKTGTGSAPSLTGGGNENTDLWFNGSTCAASDGGQTASFWIGNPNGKIPVKNVTSYDVAKLWGQYINSTIPQPATPCDLTAPNG